MTSKTYTTTIVRESGMCFIPVPFDPVAVFGRVRAPVRVTVRGYTYRSTIFSMKGCVGIPLRKSNLEAAGLAGGEKLRVWLDLDTEERVVRPPAELARALRATPGAWERWQELSYTHQREYAEAVAGAKRAETRARRIADAVRAVAARAPSKRTSGARGTRTSRKGRPSR